MILTAKQAYLFTDGRYLEKAKNLAQQGKSRLGKFTVIEMGKDLIETLKKISEKHKFSILEYEDEHISVAKYEHFRKILKGMRWQKGEKGIENQRSRKDASELKKLKKSQQINEQLFYSIRALLTPGITELEIAQQIKKRCYDHGADDISFEPIIGFGNHSSMPHHQNTTRKLKKGELVLIDMGVLFQGYASDMTRMVFTKSPTAFEEKIYNLVLEAQEAAIQAMQPGRHCDAIDQVARTLLTQAGYGETFCHSLGHGIGLEVHEAPTLSVRSKDMLQEGMVVTSEPGIYLPGQFGVRIEDMIAITKKGHENLTSAPKGIKESILS
ncbi:MAG: peptidase M24 [Candidatus Peregrinibacteria bacterium GW2011_GWA2_44_7]|nr:MAG: peptidase M24 [Candidatus Peregrinibacteria bacterium GW2011_GWA2_44_7]